MKRIIALLLTIGAGLLPTGGLIAGQVAHEHELTQKIARLWHQPQNVASVQ